MELHEISGKKRLRHRALWGALNRRKANPIFTGSHITGVWDPSDHTTGIVPTYYRVGKVASESSWADLIFHDPEEIYLRNCSHH